MLRKIKNALISVSDKSDLEKILFYLKKIKLILLALGEHSKKSLNLDIIVRKFQNLQSLKKCLMEELKPSTLKFMLEY